MYGLVKVLQKSMRNLAPEGLKQGTEAFSDQIISCCSLSPNHMSKNCGKVSDSIYITEKTHQDQNLTQCKSEIIQRTVKRKNSNTQLCVQPWQPFQSTSKAVISLLYKKRRTKNCVSILKETNKLCFCPCQKQFGLLKSSKLFHEFLKKKKKCCEVFADSAFFFSCTPLRCVSETSWNVKCRLEEYEEQQVCIIGVQ